MINNSKNENKFEDDLILCCARTNITPETKNKIKMLVKGDLDWNYLILTALKHKVIQLLYFQLIKICPDEIPTHILNILSKNFDEQAKYNLFLSVELFRILKLFKSHEIIVIPYKGPLFADRYYKNLSLRQLNNLDLIIRKEDAIKTKEMLLAHNYILKSNSDSFVGSDFTQPLKYEFVSDNSAIPINIRWDYLKKSFSCSHDLGKLWNFTKRKSSDVVTLNTYREDLLLVYCIQCAYYHWDRLSDICDIAQFIQSNDSLNWEKVFYRSKKFRLERILLINLSLVNYLFQTEYPDDILIKIKSDKPTHIISRYLIRKLFQKKDYLVNKSEKDVFYFQIRENKSDWVKDFLKSAMTPHTQKPEPFVKTPKDLIKNMLQFADIGPEDVVYDLGCGDGRIVITAAKEYGAKGVGIDINSQRIMEAKKNANTERVKDKTIFLQQDITKADISEATIVTLYVTPSFHIKIRPKLQRELRNGTRIVSKDFDLGEWTPLKTDITFFNGHIVPFYLWKI